MNYTTKFFLGANSYMDFVSYFRQLQEQSDSLQLLILKGGPGSGKSSLMKRVLEYALKKDHQVEIIPCASDPTSLDAVIDKTAHFAIMDGTSPHMEDPSVPGALHHIMYTGDLWDTTLLEKSKDKIYALNERIGDCHKGAGSYIKAAAALLKENYRYSSKFINKDFVNNFIRDIDFLIKPSERYIQKDRLLSGVSVGEIKFFDETIKSLADRVYIIEDKWGSCADYILKAIRHAAQLNGTPIIHCPCSVMPEKTDHIIIPSINTAFCTQNEFLSPVGSERLSADKLYYSMEDIAIMRQRLSDSKALLNNACALVKRAKLLHDDLEAYYVNAMDFSKMDGLFENIISRFYHLKD